MFIRAWHLWILTYNSELYFFQDVSLADGGSEPVFELSDISPTSAATSSPKGTCTVFNKYPSSTRDL